MCPGELTDLYTRLQIAERHLPYVPATACQLDDDVYITLPSGRESAERILIMLFRNHSVFGCDEQIVVYRSPICPQDGSGIPLASIYRKVPTA